MMAWNSVHVWGAWCQRMEDQKKKKKKKGRLNAEKHIISQKKDLCSHEGHILSQLPPSKFLLVPGIQNQLIWIFP